MKISVWIEAARLRTIPASLIPVLTGGALAWHHQLFDGFATGIALACAVLIQIATNFSNDYFDFRKGADTSDRVGFTRATASGEIPPKTMLTVSVIIFSIAFVLGLILVWLAGWPVLAIGIVSIIAGFLYTGGPYPIAYNGLGEIFVFIFFGIVAVMGTYYVNAQIWSMEAFWAGLAIGALSTMILVANNYRDVHTDRKAGKNTLTVLLGERFSRWQYLLLCLVAFAIPPHFYVQEGFPMPVLLPMILAPWAFLLVKQFWQEKDKAAFNNILIRTAQFMTAFGVLYSIGIILS